MIASFAVKAGMLLLGARARFSRRATPEDLFSDLWNFCLHYKFLFALREYFPNRFHIPLQNLLFRKIIEVVRAKYPAYKPKVRVRTSEAISALFNMEEKIIIVTIHTAVSSIIIEILQELGIKCSLIVADAPNSQAELLGYNTKIDVILRSQDVFLIAKSKLKEGKVIFCCADERSRDNQLYIGTGIFDFAKTINAKMINFIAQVSDEGEVFINLAAIKTNRENLSSMDLAQDFVSFINAASKKKNTLKISSWKLENKL